MYSAKRQLGNVGEGIACDFLRLKGYRIIEQNVNRVWGEIDIVAQKGSVYHLVEVKTSNVTREMGESVADAFSRVTSGGWAEGNATPQKLKKVERSARAYLASKRTAAEAQIDVLAVYMLKEKRIARCKLYEQVL